MPHIRLLGPIPSHLCEKFASCFSPGVIDIVKDPKTGENSVKVCPFQYIYYSVRSDPQISNPRNDTVSREVLRHKEFEDLVELGRIRDFFICMTIEFVMVTRVYWFLTADQIESEGPYEPEQLLPEAILVLRTKIAEVRKAVIGLQSDLSSEERMDTQ